MADRPILFSAPMVRALLDGRKTQTRRVIKPQPPADVVRHCWYDAPIYGFTKDSDVTGDWHKARLLGYNGDRLYVREHWRTTAVLDDIAPRDLRSSENETVDYTPIRYEADGAARNFNPLHDPDFGRFRQGMHMPRWASRLTLIVTDVRVERLQSISEEDALAEGVPADDDYAGSFAKEYCDRCGGSGVHGALGEGYGAIEVDCAECETPKLRYRNLWNHINRPGAWESNPWVVAYTFTVHRGNIDQTGGAA